MVAGIGVATGTGSATIGSLTPLLYPDLGTSRNPRRPPLAMLLSSMDHLGYYSMPKENFLELDASAGVAGPDGYALPPEDLGVVSYMNEENSPKNGTKSSLYKTELCKRFSEFGNCRYGGASSLIPLRVFPTLSI
ncbi:unnamed protein product [Phytophthora fragariaefolia]|uniref:Unnamed protein product n=1 Tax=Phytophthora fragariaefolia TaxID=1490495 RepID=A0A9W6XPU5_9STRA|nr:unnamed protein product [Phytophthora fragariaefolia]